jgi:Cu/Ag efflux protein CusF
MISGTTQEKCHPDRSGAKASGVEGPAFLRIRSNRPFNPSAYRLAFLCLSSLLIFSAACNRAPSQPAATAQSAAKRYALKGKVVSIDKQSATANINNEPISGLMDPMVMPYAIKPPAALDQLQPGDTITADVVVQVDNTYWLENVKIIGHSKTPDGKLAP